MIFSHAAECSVKSTFSVTAECWCSSLEEQRRLPVDVKPRSRKLECSFRWKRAVSLRTIDEPDRKINTAALLASNQCVLALLKNWLKPYEPVANRQVLYPLPSCSLVSLICSLCAPDTTTRCRFDTASSPNPDGRLADPKSRCEPVR